MGQRRGVAVPLGVGRRDDVALGSGDALGMDDRILDASTAASGTLFFAPSANQLAALADVVPQA